MIDGTGLLLSSGEGGRKYSFEDVKVMSGQTGLVVWDNRAGRSVLFHALMGATASPHSDWTVSANLNFGGDRKYLCLSNPEIQISNCFQGALAELCIPMLAQGAPPNRQKSNAEFLATIFGLPQISTALIRDYSSGEKQRLLLASILAADADCVLFDGVLDYIDPEARPTIVALISQIARSRGISCLIGSSTPLNDVEGLFDIVVHLDNDRASESVRYRQEKQLVRDDAIAALEVRSLSYLIPGRSDLLYDNLSLRVSPGRGLIIRGPNGSGKSTLGNLLAGTISPAKGRIEICGEAPQKWLKEREPRIGFSFSDPDLALSKATVGAELEGTREGILSAEAFEAIVNVLRLNDKLDLSPFDLDWHFRKRVSLAKALKMARPLAFIDEPSVDATTIEKEEVARALHTAAENGVSVLAATNDEHLINALPDFDLIALPKPELVATDPSDNDRVQQRHPSELWRQAGPFWLRNTGEFSLFWAKNIYPSLRNLVSGLALTGPATILDVGCGHGLHTAAIANLFSEYGNEPFSAIGIDKEKDFVTIASSFFATKETLKFVQMDVASDDLDLGLNNIISSNERLAVVALFSLHDISSLAALKAYLARSAAQIECLIFVLLDPDFVKRSYEPEAMPEAEDDWTSFFAVNASAGPIPIHLPYYYRDAEVYEAFISELGFVPRRMKLVQTANSLVRGDDVTIIWSRKSS